MIRGLWERQTDTIINVKLGDAVAGTYIFQPMAALLDRWDKIKKYKHGKH